MYVTQHRKIPMDSTSNGYKHCFWCISEKARWSISEYSRHNRYCWWYNHLWKITGRTWCMLSQLSFNHEEEQSMIKCFEITIPTWRIILFWHKWNSKGISPDPKKIHVIKQMVFPPDKESMQSFLGMINFLNRYSPWLAELSTTLRELCRIHTDYKPKSEHHKSFDAIKRELSTNIILPYYDPTLHTTLQTDSSKKGLGAVLIPNGTPIYFVGRAISTTEANYQNLKWETLAMIWGMEKFHYFLYRNTFTLETDQKPLVSIYQKHLIDVSPRIQRVIVCALPYNFHIVYVPGKEILMANALLRNLRISEDKEEDQISLPILAVNYITSNYQQYPEKFIMNKIREETSKDATLQLLAKYITNGWPVDQKKIHKELHPYWNYRDEISIEDGAMSLWYKYLYWLSTELL